MSISNYLEEKILNKVLRNTNFTVTTVYVSLHTADPGETGTSEVSTGGYSRQSAAFDAASNPAGTSINSAVIDFASMPAVSVTHAGLWDAATTGNFLWGGPLDQVRNPTAGDTVEIAAGNLMVTLQ